MAFFLVENIRKNSREQWQKLAKDKWIDTRIWVQEHGEIALVAGVLIGSLAVLFLRFFVALLAIAIIIGLFIYFMSLPADQMLETETSEESPDPDDEQ